MAQRTYPQGGTTATHVLGYVGDITSSYLAAHPNDGYTQGSQIGVSGIEAQYEPYLRGVDGRQALSVDASGTVVGTLSTTAPQIGDTVVLNIDTGLQQAVQNDLQQQILADRQTLDAIDNKYPPAPNGAVVVMNPQNGQVLAMASYPSYDLNEWVGGISSANFAALQASGAENNYAIEGQYTPGSTFKLVTATAALQAGLIAPGTPYYDIGPLQDHRAARRPGSTTTPGASCSDNPGDGTGTYNVTRRADRVERRVLLPPGRPCSGRSAARSATRRSRTRRPPTARGPSPASTSPGRRRGGSTATCSGPSCTPRRPRRSPMPPRGSPATTSRWPSGRARPC